jgi:hypothetical protein
MTLVLGVMAPAVVMAEPNALTNLQLDTVTAGTVAIATAAEGIAAGDQFAAAGTGAVAETISDQVGDVELGTGAGASAAHAGACCGGAAAVGSAAIGVGDTAAGGSQTVLLDTLPHTIGASASFIGATSSNVD